MLKHNDATRALLADETLAKRWTAFEAHANTWEYFSAGEGRDPKTARKAFGHARRALPSLLTESAKTLKSLKLKALTGICYLAPADESGFNVCPFSSSGCRAACLGHSSGRMAMTVNGGLGDHKRARILRTWAFLGHRALFLQLLAHEVSALQKRAERKGLRPFVRFNGTSDLPVENWGFMEVFPNVQFYDYTKNVGRAMEHARGEMPFNYHLTFSRSEENAGSCAMVLDAGGNVAAVFLGELPETYRGRRVVDGDETDARPDDSRGVWVGLTTKGPKAARDTSGFVIR